MKNEPSEGPEVTILADPEAPKPTPSRTDAVPIEALQMPDDKEQMQPPEVGDEVNYTVTGKVTAIAGGVAQVERSSINGQPIGGPGHQEPDGDEDENSLREMAGDMDEKEFGARY